MAQLAQRVGVERARGDPGQPERPAAIDHLGRGLVGERDDQHLVRGHHLGRDRVRRPAADHAGLAGAGSRVNRHGPAGRADRDFLLGIEVGQEALGVEGREVWTHRLSLAMHETITTPPAEGVAGARSFGLLDGNVVRRLGFRRVAAFPTVKASGVNVGAVAEVGAVTVEALAQGADYKRRCIAALKLVALLLVVGRKALHAAVKARHARVFEPQGDGEKCAPRFEIPARERGRLVHARLIHGKFRKVQQRERPEVIKQRPSVVRPE